MKNVSDEQLIVYYCKEPILQINRAMLDRKNAWDNLEKIKELHHEIVRPDLVIMIFTLKICIGLSQLCCEITLN